MIEELNDNHEKSKFMRINVNSQETKLLQLINLKKEESLQIKNLQDVLQNEFFEEGKVNLKTENTNCLALTVRKEYKLTIAKNIINKSARISWKVALSIIVMNFLNFLL